MAETQTTGTESFRKRWSDATTIISLQDLQNAEQQPGTGTVCVPQPRRIGIVNGNEHHRTDAIDRTQNHCNDNANETQHRIEIVDSSREHEANTREAGFHSSTKHRLDRPRSLTLGPLDNREHDCFTSKTHNQCMMHVSHSRMQCRTIDLSPSPSDLTACDPLDWLLLDWSRSRSLPSPADTCKTPETAPVSISSSNPVFNFSPELTSIHQASTGCLRAKRRLFDDVLEPETSGGLSHTPTNSDVISSQSGSVPPWQYPSKDHCASHRLKPRDLVHLEKDNYLIHSSVRSNTREDSEGRNVLSPKRPLDCQEYTNHKRIKIDVEREMGHRYIQRLESDIANIRRGLGQTGHEAVASCTCAIMERQFLQMAESAYRKLRRSDASPRGFQQFRSELVQTNEVMKDSMEVLKNIRRFCEH